MLEGSMPKAFPLLIFLLASQTQAAEFLPQDTKNVGRNRDYHWLDNDFISRMKNPSYHSVCAEALSEKGRWVTESAFYWPETQIQMGLQLAGGGAIWNSNPYEYQFAFPPEAFVNHVPKIFEYYRRLPITYLSLNSEDGVSYQGWDELFQRAELRAHLSAIETLKVSSDGLSALSKTNVFANARTLILEPKGADQVLALLRSQNFPKWHRLYLISTHLSAKEFTELVSAPEFSQIDELSLTMMNFGDQGLQALTNSKTIAEISALSLEFHPRQACPNRPTVAGLKTLFGAGSRLALKKLSVRSIWELGPEALPAIFSWPGMESLEYLEFPRSESTQTIAHFLRNRSLPHLRELRLEQSTYDDKVLDAIADNASLTSLRRIAIHLDAGISRDAVTAARNAPHLRDTVVAYDITK